MRARGVRWDEANIEEIEANKPVRQKITEPKTPYHPTSKDEDSVSPVPGSFEDCIGDTMDSDIPFSALSDEASSSQKNSRRSGWTSSEDEGDAMDQVDEGKSSRFREQRRTHYDEFHEVRKLRKTKSLLEDQSQDKVDEDETVNDSSLTVTSGVRDIEIEEGSGNSEQQQVVTCSANSNGP